MCTSLWFDIKERPKKYFPLSAWCRKLYRPGPQFFIIWCSSRIDWQNQFLFPDSSFSEELASYWLLTLYVTNFLQWKQAAFTGMVLCKLIRRNYGRKSSVSIYQNLHSFKEGVILLCQSFLETRRITHLHGSALFTIPFPVFSIVITLVDVHLNWRNW